MKKFIELLRKGTHEAAIGCLRTCVAPCALDAYPVLEYSIPCCLSLFFVTYYTLLYFIVLLDSCFWVLNLWNSDLCIYISRKLMRNSSMFFLHSSMIKVTKPLQWPTRYAMLLLWILSDLVDTECFFFFWTAAIHHAEFVFWIIRNCTFCSSVGREKKVWNGWTDVICLESFFASIWSTIFNDTKISDKVYSFSTLLLSIVFSLNLMNHLFYLTSIHKGFCFHQGISSAVSDLTHRLLLEERDAPAPPLESMYEVPPFDEVTWQLASWSSCSWNVIVSTSWHCTHF